jgi:hypothetical protein
MGGKRREGVISFYCVYFTLSPACGGIFDLALSHKREREPSLSSLLAFYNGPSC